METSHNYLFVSDFHLSEGRNPKTGLIHRNEDFFQDNAFAQFIAHHVQQSYDPTMTYTYQKPWQLIVNGDIFDFLQVVSLPEEGDELARITGKRKISELRQNTCEFGLGTSEKEIVWKVEQIAKGHPLFFQALAWFVAHEGNELILLKGNHDVELYWTAVQNKMKELLADAYQDWQAISAVGSDMCPLPNSEGLPDSLSKPVLHRRVRFLPFFHYEPGLFYAEHGCQYDPVNYFQDFEDPRLVDSEGRPLPFIELPKGSLFVRYFFNKVEATHPFADNLKPITRYFFWLFSNSQSELVSFMTVLLPQYMRASKEVSQKLKTRKKVRYVRQVDGRLQQDPVLEPLQTIQAGVRDSLDANGKVTTRRMIASIVLALLAIFLLLISIRTIAVGDYGLTLVSLFFMLVCVFAASYYFKSLDHLLADPYLFSAAEQIAELLHGRPTEEYAPVRYYIFGHDHAARLMKMRSAPQFNQWYINTGSWIPVFSENEKLTRPAANLTFMRLIPARLPANDLPELLRWSEEANAPLEVRMFGDIEDRDCENNA